MGNVIANISISFIAGQQLLIPLRFNIDPPSAFNDTDGSPSSFGSTCVEQGTFYQCNNNTNNPLFNCSASNNSYYGWTDQQLSVSSTFVQDHYFQLRKNFSEINVSVIFLISTASNVSVPTELQYSVFLDGIFVSTVRDDNPPASLPEGPYQYNYTLSPGGEFNQVVITIYRNTTFQWIAINRIIFCAASTEGLCPYTLDYIIVCVPVAVVVVWGFIQFSIDHL